MQQPVERQAAPDQRREAFRGAPLNRLALVGQAREQRRHLVFRGRRAALRQLLHRLDAGYGQFTA